MTRKSKSKTRTYVNDLLVDLGFENYGKSWRICSSDVDFIIELVASKWTPGLYYLECGVWLKGIPENKEYAKEYKFDLKRPTVLFCHYKFRSTEISKKHRGDCPAIFWESSPLSDDKRKLELKKELEGVVVPYLLSFTTAESLCRKIPKEAQQAPLYYFCERIQTVSSNRKKR